MNRERSFKGKNKKSGIWEYGSGFKDNLVNEGGGKMTHYVFINETRVDEDTVVEQTPFIDIDGTKAFEGDQYITGYDVVYTIFYVNGAFCGGINIHYCQPLGWELSEGEITKCDWFNSTAKIIGNIHD